MEYNVLDTLHRGYVAYLNETENDNQYRKLVQVMLNTDPQEERCDTILRTCDITSDWIEEIEKALPFIEKAVSENRQFILRQGEIVPIEKVRRVSKTSVEHLARHSQMITREPAPGEDIVPEKILMTENVGTYAVYENRFLYMLLCYIKDFVQIKQSKISDRTHSFTAETVVKNALSLPNRKINFSLHFQESAMGVTLPAYPSKTQDCLDRMKNILLTVDALLKTNLMIEVSTAPMLKPPITRTNVLIHNPCFVAAIDLFDYLSAYTGDGYTERELFSRQGALDQSCREDYAQLISMTSYLAYRQGGLWDELETRYQYEEIARLQAKREAANRHLTEMKEKLTDLSPEAAEYILALEEKCAEADTAFDKFARIRELIRMAQQKVEEVEKQNEALQSELADKIDELREKEMQEQLTATAHQEEMSELQSLMNQKDTAHRDQMNELQKLLNQKNAEQQKLVESHADAMAALNEQYRTQYAQIADRYHLISARLHALQAKSEEGVREDFTSKQGFAVLEAEFTAFKRFYDAQWKLTKARIRKDKLSKKTDYESSADQEKEADEQ